MLQKLTISNYALIDHLEMSPATGLSIITGETGAGKSIMLGAVGLLLGNRADTKVLLDDSRKCVIEGEFEIGEYNLRDFFEESDLDYENPVIIRREISTTGKSRGFVNDTPVNLDVMRTLGANLMDVHSQNDTQLLGSPSFQLKIVDAFSDSLDLFSEYQVKFRIYQVALSKYKDLLREEEQIRKESDFDTFLLDELQKASFSEGEQTQLEDEQDILSNSEEIKSNIFQALGMLSGEQHSVIVNMESLVHVLRQLAKYSSHYSALSERVESVLIELNDIRHELETEDEKIEHDPERISEIQDRLGLLYHLMQKHHVNDIKSLLDIQGELEGKVSRFQNLDEELKTAKVEMENAETNALEVARLLSSKRKTAFDPLCKILTGMLGDLGMPDAVLQIDHEQTNLSPNGVDTINILFSANKGISPQPLKSVASGGEFSRLMFCIKYILANKMALPTLIFDEIDTGVSGEIAIQLGTMMREMASGHQVISISHLPQMAAKADKHFYVFKDNESEKAASRIKMLSEEERIEQIAKMIAGDNPTTSAFASARELIEAK